MATFKNTRRRVVTVNPFENAEGIIPLSFKNLKLGVLGERDFTSKRNGFDVTKFTAYNPVNGDTIAVLTQLELRDKALKAFDHIEAGGKVTVKNLYGGRARKDFQTGMTTIAAKGIEFELHPIEGVGSAPAGNVPAAVIAQSELAAAQPASEFAN